MIEKWWKRLLSLPSETVLSSQPVASCCPLWSVGWRCLLLVSSGRKVREANIKVSPLMLPLSASTATSDVAHLLFHCYFFLPPLLFLHPIFHSVRAQCSLDVLSSPPWYGFSQSWGVSFLKILVVPEQPLTCQCSVPVHLHWLQWHHSGYCCCKI